MGSDTRQLSVFFFPLMAHGHTIPMIDIARQFAARGTKSTIITTPLNAIHLADSIDRDKKSGLDMEIQIILFPRLEAGLPEGCENMDDLTSPDMVYNFFLSLYRFRESLERLLEEHHPDCLVADMFLPWTTDAAKKFGVPRLVFHGTSTFSLCVVDNIVRYAPELKVTSDSEEVFVLPSFPGQIEFKRSQMGTRGDSLTRFIEFRKEITETELTSFGVVVNSFYELEPAYADHYKGEMRRKTWNIGPVSLSNRNALNKAHRGRKATIDEHHCINWLNSKEHNSVLYVSFGSMSRFNTAQLLEIAIGLESSKVSFIWVVRMDKTKAEEQFLPDGFEERMKGKCLIIKDWAPQMLILDHPAIGGFMTHCGWNSILEGITAGVPFITWPLFAEQFNNEKLVIQVLQTGIPVGNEVWILGTEIEDVSVTKGKVEEAVTRLMGKGEEAEDMRQRARELGERAKKAVEEGGSSYTELTSLLEELRVHSQKLV